MENVEASICLELQIIAESNCCNENVPFSCWTIVWPFVDMNYVRDRVHHETPFQGLI